MRLLLDTHIALWAVTGHPNLPNRATELILTAEAVFVSAASIWEISIKHALKPKQMTLSGGDAIKEFSAAGFAILPVTGAHAAAIDSLPAHHRDPFDRILIAQALAEPLRLVTHDSALRAYSDIVLWV